MVLYFQSKEPTPCVVHNLNGLGKVYSYTHVSNPYAVKKGGWSAVPDPDVSALSEISHTEKKLSDGSDERLTTKN